VPVSGGNYGAMYSSGGSGGAAASSSAMSRGRAGAAASSSASGRAGVGLVLERVYEVCVVGAFYVIYRYKYIYTHKIHTHNTYTGVFAQHLCA